MGEAEWVEMRMKGFHADWHFRGWLERRRVDEDEEGREEDVGGGVHGCGC